MAKTCSECGKELTFRDSFVYKDKPVCGNCLKTLEAKESPSKAVQMKVTQVILTGHPNVIWINDYIYG